MDALDASALSGSLVVCKAIAGDVAVSVTPQVVLRTNSPTVIAVGRSAVRHAVNNSNLRDLLKRKHISVVI